MSSIFGKCNADNKPVSISELNIMLDGLDQWGADDKNVWHHESTGLGHLMLYNTPESLTEKQPLHDGEARLTITADARIDNRKELFLLLGTSSPDEQTMPDSSLLLLMYRKYGPDCVKHILGDFAFAIWDEKTQQMFCARDQMGVKPFFYYCKDGFFAFASEKKGILCIPETDKTINKDFFYNEVLPASTQAADTTLYKCIHRLPPATTLIFSKNTNKIRLDKYWDLDPFKELILADKRDYYEGLRHHFEEAVKCRLRSHYPIGIELSGGMDSSSIAGVASHFLKPAGKSIISFTNTDTPESLPYSALKGGNEQAYAEAVIAFNEIKDTIFITSQISDDPLQIADVALKVNDGIEMWTQFWQLPIKQAAMERNIRTIFSGFPGDEMATYKGGYHYLDYFYNREYKKYFKAARTLKFKKIKPVIGAELDFAMHKIKNLLPYNNKNMKIAESVFHFPLKYKIKKGDVAWQDEHYRERFKSYRHFQKFRLLKAQVPLRMEAETRFGLNYKMEPRFPMADIRLAQYYLSLPNPVKYEGTINRSAWRTAIGQYLPPEVLARESKTGVFTPYTSIPSRKQKEIDLLLRMLNELPDAVKKKVKVDVGALLKVNSLLKYIYMLQWYKNNFEKL